MTYDAALAHLETQRLLGTGLLNTSSRVGWALHSETLETVSLTKTPGPVLWIGHQQDGRAAHAPLPPAWQPQGWGRTGGALTPHTLAGRFLRHKKGGLYIGIAPCLIGTTMHVVYAGVEDNRINPLWWVRPWSMLADGRFALEPGTLPW